MCDFSPKQVIRSYPKLLIKHLPWRMDSYCRLAKSLLTLRASITTSVAITPSDNSLLDLHSLIGDADSLHLQAH